MSHATYAFLISLDATDVSETEATNQARDALKKYAEHWCDENNWYQAEALVLSDGRFIGLLDRDWMIDKLETMPAAERWQWANLFAMQCVATDFELGGRRLYNLGQKEADPPYWNDAVELKEKLLEEIPNRLSELWKQGPLLPVSYDKGTRHDDPHFLDRYRRDKWSRQFGLFLDGISYRENSPFTQEGTPYDYRAFDLTAGACAHAILFVDIHT